MSIITSVFVNRINSGATESHVKERLVNQNNVPVMPTQQVAPDNK